MYGHMDKQPVRQLTPPERVVGVTGPAAARSR
jgi:hypothetical protein